MVFVIGVIRKDIIAVEVLSFQSLTKFLIQCFYNRVRSVVLTVINDFSKHLLYPLALCLERTPG